MTDSQDHFIVNYVISAYFALINGKFLLDVWKRPSKRPLPDSADVITRFEIPYARVLPIEADQTNNSKKYVVYDVSVNQVSASADDNNPTTIERRYTHFLQLYEALKKDFPAHMNNQQFPKKVLIGNFNADLIADRAAAFEVFLDYIIGVSELRESTHFLDFLQNDELVQACKYLDERRVEQAVPILENCFQLVNKVYLDKSKPVLLLLCRLVAACANAPLPHPLSEKWAELALRRYEHVCDTELLVLYIPLLHTCSYLW